MFAPLDDDEIVNLLNGLPYEGERESSIRGSNQEPVDQEAVHNNAGLVNNPDSVVESLLKIRGLVSGLLFDENGELSTGDSNAEPKQENSRHDVGLISNPDAVERLLMILEVVNDLLSEKDGELSVSNDPDTFEKLLIILELFSGVLPDYDGELSIGCLNTEPESIRHSSNPDTAEQLQMILELVSGLLFDKDDGQLSIRGTSNAEPEQEVVRHDIGLGNIPDTPEELNEFLDLVNGLPSEESLIMKVSKISKEIHEEKLKIIKTLRDAAEYLEKTQNRVVIADRVGTGVRIGGSLLTIAGLIAAPYTAGASLRLTVAGTAGGVIGGVTSAGANLAGHLILKTTMDRLKKSVEAFNVKLEEFANLAEGSVYLTRAVHNRPSLERLNQLSESGFFDLLVNLWAIVQHTLDGNVNEFGRSISKDILPEVKEWLHNFNLSSISPELLGVLHVTLSQILSQCYGVWNSMKAITNYLAQPELARLAMSLSSMSATARSAEEVAKDAAQVSAAFKGTPLAMSNTARYIAVGYTTAFIAVDVYHMVRICQETGESPTVLELRSLADRMETDLMADNDGASSLRGFRD